MTYEKRLIDANKTKGIIQEAINESDFQLFKDVMREVCNILDHSDIVDAVEVVHGEWKSYGKNFYAYYYKCSVCGEIHDGKKNYCHNCGAKMDGDLK